MTEALKQGFLYVPIPALFTSIAIHVGIASLIISIHVSGIWKGVDRNAKKSLYQDFIQVDVVALPDTLPNQKLSVDVAQPVVERPKPSLIPPIPPKSDVLELPDAKTKRVQQPIQSEQDRALKELEKEASRERALKDLALNREKGTGRAVLKGNIAAQGNAAKGELGTPKDLYDARVRKAIQEHFNVYSWQKKRGLVTIVHLELYPTGRVRKKEIVSSSKDKLYDAAVLQAIDRAQPLPVPADLSLIANGITVEFTPTETP